MARSSALVLIFFLVFASSVSCLESRKLLTNKKNRDIDSNLFGSLVLSALPKGSVGSSSPSKKGYHALDNEKIFARHLASMDRILRSVPSPGVGN